MLGWRHYVAGFFLYASQRSLEFQPECAVETQPLQHLLGYRAGEEMLGGLYFCKRNKSQVHYGVISYTYPKPEDLRT